MPKKERKLGIDLLRIISMLMIVDLDTSSLSFDAIQSGLAKVGESLGVEIRLQRESIFDAMHRI